MRSLFTSIFAFALVAAVPAAAAPSKFELERNATLETVQIMLLLAPSWRTPNVGVRPAAERAKTYFARFADHPSILLLDRMMREEGSPWISWLQILNVTAIASEQPVPRASYDRKRIGFPDFAFPKQNVATAEQFMSAVNRFYRDAHVEKYLRESQPAYNCAFSQVQADLPAPSLLPAMESYYGVRLGRYVVIPSPLENNFVNMNVRVKTLRGIDTFMIVAPNRRAKTAEEFGCGFEEGKDLKWIAIHEFGHSFVNPVLETPEMKARSARFAHLYSPIKDEQSMQGMPDWEGTVIEHVVRLGEIRVLEKIGDKGGAQARRLDNILERKFIYLPLLEDRIKDYETDRSKYPTFESFAPRLIDAFSDEETGQKD